MTRHPGPGRPRRPGLVPALPRPVWVVLGGDFISAAGLNAGLGLGALAAAAVVSVTHPATFTAVYLADAASFLAFVPVLARLRIPALLCGAAAPGQTNSPSHKHARRTRPAWAGEPASAPFRPAGSRQPWKS